MRATPIAQPSQKRKRSSPSITELEESMALPQTCPQNLSSSSAPSRQRRRKMLEEQQLKNKSIISKIKKTAEPNEEPHLSDFQVETCSPDQPHPTKYYISPNYEGPETSMTVCEAECASESDTD